MDFNDDDLLDLIVGDRNGFIHFFRRKTDNTLTAEPNIVAGGVTIDAGNNSAPFIVDWNEDGLLDMLVGNESPGHIRIYLNSGTPSSYLYTTYTTLKKGAVEVKHSRSCPHVADLNLDGKKDVIIGEDYGAVYYLENVGTQAAPLFATEVILEANGAPIKWPSGQTDTRVWVNDWNEDGLPDLLLGNYVKNVHLYLHKPGVLKVSAKELSVATGGAITFTLDGGRDISNRSYFLLGSLTGTEPGLPLPGGMVSLPLNWDFFTDLTISLANSPALTNTHGTLNGGGQATAQLDSMGPLPPSALGATLYFAFLLYYPAIYYPYDYVSNPVSIEVVP